MLKHVPGSKMGKAYSLSRRPDWEVEVEKDNEDKTVMRVPGRKEFPTYLNI